MGIDSWNRQKIENKHKKLKKGLTSKRTINWIKETVCDLYDYWMIKFLQAVPMAEKILLSPHRGHIVQVTLHGWGRHIMEKKMDLSGCRANNCREDRPRE